LDADITVGGELNPAVGTVVLAAGWKPYDATKLVKLGYGLSRM
jgi:heterodisulfide reductase subunit A-like polyferredoxin